MKSSTLIVWLLVAAFVAIDLAMIAQLQLRRNEWPEAGGVVGLGLAFSQVAVLALWTVWGRNNILVRGVGTLLGVWALSCLASYSTTGARIEGTWFGVLLMYSIASLVPLIVVRFASFTLSNENPGNGPFASSRLSSNQFTVWGLLSLMTAVGITLAVARFAEFPVAQLLEVSAFFALLAVSVCSVLVIDLLTPKMRYAVIATVLICPIAGILLSLTDLAPGEGVFLLPAMMCASGATNLFAAVALRSAGYRLVRHTQASGATAPRSSDDCESAMESPFAEP